MDLEQLHHGLCMFSGVARQRRLATAILEADLALARVEQQLDDSPARAVLGRCRSIDFSFRERILIAISSILAMDARVQVTCSGIQHKLE